MSVFSSRAGILRLAFATCIMGFAVLFAGTAQAAKPVEYVRVCSLYGAGFFYIPGTDTCIKLGGYFRADATQTGTGWLCNGNYVSSSKTCGRDATTVDVRQCTEYGTVRAYVQSGGFCAPAPSPTTTWTGQQGGQWMGWTRQQSGGWASPYDWTGFYIGVNTGGSWSTVRTTEFLTGTDIVTNKFTNSGQSWTGGINIGYDWQFNRNWVVGVTVDANAVNDQPRQTFFGGSYLGTTLDFAGSVQGRVGWLATPAFLLYVKGGVAVGDLRQQINFGGPVTDNRQSIIGWTVGGGTEFKLPFAPGFGKSNSVFLDYQWTGWEKTSLSRPAASPGFDYTFELGTFAVQTGYRVKF